jgi:hypothetical protein
MKSSSEFLSQQLRNRRLYVGGSRYEVGQIFLSLWYTA